MEGNRFDDLTRLLSSGGSRRGVIRGLAAGLIAGTAGLLGLSGADAAKCRGYGHICREGANCCDGGCAKDSRGRRRCCIKNGGLCTNPGRCCGEARCGQIGDNQQRDAVCCLPIGTVCDPSGDNVCCNGRRFQPLCGGVGPKPICCIPNGFGFEGSARGEVPDASCCSGLMAEGFCTSTCEAPGAACNADQGLYCCTGRCDGNSGQCCLPSGTTCNENGPACCNGGTCVDGRCCAFEEEACDDINGPACCFGSCVSGSCFSG